MHAVVPHPPPPRVLENDTSLVVALKKCSRSRDLELGRRLHLEAAEQGLLTGTNVFGSLINMYASCGSMADARKVFDTLERKSLACWNCLIRGYVNNGESELALEVFDKMETRDARTFVAGLTACAALSSKGDKGGRWLEKGRSIHAAAVECSCSHNVFLESTLVHMYSKAGCMDDARHVFDRMKLRNVVSWNALLQGYVDNGEAELALEIFDEMQRGLCSPNARTYVAALTACSTMRNLEKGASVHLQARENGCSDNIYVQNTLVDMYGKCRCTERAREMFDGMAYRNAVSYTALLYGYVENGQSEMALELFEKMVETGACVPNERTFAVALTACLRLVGDGNRMECLEKGKAIHSRAVLYKCGNNRFVRNTLVELYSKLGETTLAREVFEEIPSQDIISWNALLHGYVDNGKSEMALELFHRLERCDGCVPDSITYVGVLSACAALAVSLGENVDQVIEKGKMIHSQAVRSSCSCDVYVQTTLVNMYSKFRRMVEARLTFETIVDQSVITWSCLLQGYADNGDNRLVLEMIHVMEETGVLKNSETYMAALVACGNMPAVEAGKAFHAELRSLGFEKEVMLATCVLDFYGKCGEMEAAREVFDSLAVKDLWAWNTLMSGYCQQGDTGKVFEVFERLREQGLAPNEVTFTHVLTVCSHGGLVEEGREYFDEMQRRYGVTPNLVHYNCMVDLFGRANRLEEALGMIKEMPFQPNSVSWGTLLGACEKWRNVELGELAYNSLMCVSSRERVTSNNSEDNKTNKNST